MFTNGVGFKHSKNQFKQNKTGHVAFIGGSITEMNGYRPLPHEVPGREISEDCFLSSPLPESLRLVQQLEHSDLRMMS